MKNIIIFGGTGFIGRHLIHKLGGAYNITVFSRNVDKAKSSMPRGVSLAKYPNDAGELASILNHTDGVINLAGENIGGGRWTRDFKAKILSSRLDVIQQVNEAFHLSKKKPAFLIQGSASGYYGINPSDAEITEERPSSHDSFLTNVAAKQEEAVASLKTLTRLVLIRTGIVLDRTEGALPQMAMPFKMFAGGPLGNGKQWLPWIHIKDEVLAIKFIMENENISGAVNLTAPTPLRQKDFASLLGKALHRPSILPAPAFALKALLGKEKAEDLLLSGLRVIPAKLLKSGYSFQFEELESALEEIYG